MVTASFKEGQKTAITTSLQKYDYGEVLRIKGLSLPRYVAVQFAVDGMSEALPSSIGETVEDVTDVLIPNSLLRSNIKPWNYNIMAYVYIVSGSSGKTEYTITIPVKWRPKTGDDQAADDDVAAVIGSAVEKMNTATTKAENAANQASATAEEIKAEREKITTNEIKIAGLKSDKVDYVQNLAAVSKLKRDAALDATSTINDDGSITVNNKEIKDLTSKELREFRKDLGMIFQHFSLLERLNVYENVALPLECWGYSKEEINKKVDELLRLVGLENKAKNKPKHLSGGQKQRVAIARALALNPNILLCDEATSALDPNTTKSILSLLRDINKKLGITIIIVTHQMEVVKEVCNKVAILKDGKVLECGDTEELFLNHSECLKELLGEEEVVPNSGVNIKLFFPKEFSNGYIITSMARSLDIDFSIVWGKLEKFRDDVLGSLIINIPQDKKEQVINYLNLTDVKWEVLQNKENKINNKELERA